jgi:hypothetical protein
MVVIILISYILFFFIFIEKDGTGLREALVKSFLVEFLLILFSTEVLSLINQITYKGVLFFWILIVIFESIALLGLVRSKKYDIALINYLKGKVILDWFEWLILFFIGLTCSVTLLIALLSPPNNYDSMTYHMARVAEWIQYQNVNFYPTAIPRQNYSPPLAEYAILHLQVLSKSDYFANLVQWSSYLIAIILTSLVVKELKIPLIYQMGTGLITATIPMLILQSTSTQNDLLAGVFCLSFAYYLLKLKNLTSWENSLFVSISLGLALLTKGTSYIYCASIGLIIGGSILLLKKQRRIKRIIRFFLIIMFALLLNSGFYIRNINLYGHPLSTAVDRITNDNFSLPVVYSNLVRNGAMHFATPFPIINDSLNQTVVSLLGFRLNSSESTFEGSEFQAKFLINGDYSGNTIHSLLIGFALLFLLFNKGYTKRSTAYFQAMIVTSIVLYCILIKWQPWGTRLHIPVFLMGSILVGMLLDRLSITKVGLAFFVTGMFIFSIPYLMFNNTRPLVPILKQESSIRQKKIFLYTANKIDKFLRKFPDFNENLSSIKQLFYKDQSVLRMERTKLYYMSNSDYYQDYSEVARIIEEYQVSEIGLIFDNNAWEYPIWVLSNSHAGEGEIEYRHIAVDDISRTLQQEGLLLPTLVLATREFNQTIAGVEYEIILDTDNIDVLRKTD